LTTRETLGIFEMQKRVATTAIAGRKNNFITGKRARRVPRLIENDFVTNDFSCDLVDRLL